MAYVKWLVFFLCFEPIWSLPRIVNIGGLFDTDDKSLEDAFRTAITNINQNGTIMPRNTRLEPQIETVNASNSFQASKAVCRLMSRGVAAIFGPQSRDSWVHVQSVCDTLSVPHFDTRWNYNWKRNSLNSVNLFPHGPTLGKAFQYMVNSWEWTSFAVIYQDNEGLTKIKDVWNPRGRFPPRIMTVQLPTTGQYHETLRKIMKKDLYNITIDCDASNIYEVLKQAQQIGMMTDKHHYFITSLDVHTVNLNDFSYSGTIIHYFRLVNISRPEVSAVMNSMTSITDKPWDPSSEIKALKSEAAIMYDAVHILAYGLRRLNEVTNPDIKPLNCHSDEKWAYGETLFNYLNENGLPNGLSGKVSLDSKGDRTLFDLEAMELHLGGQSRIGEWTSRFPFSNVTGSLVNKRKPLLPPDDILKGRHLTIMMIMVNPYIMKTETVASQSGNERFEGYCIDLLKELSTNLEFTYTLLYDPAKSHDALVEAVKNGSADLGIGDITITSDRQKVVDLTTPFMNTGISILFKKSTASPPSLLSFLSPFSNYVWVLMGMTYMVVSVTLFIVARLTPYEWDNPYPCIQDPDEVENSFTILNSMWFTIGSLMQQGSDIAPKASSTRAMAAIWWFFTLIMISSYTANLAAFLTVESLHNPISKVEDLYAQNKIKYGCVEDGSTRKFFMNSKVPLYQGMWNVMKTATPSVFVKDNDKGKERVKQGNYAFFIESASNEYIAERDCDLIQVGGLLDAKGYGIAMKKDSPFRNVLSAEILRLREKDRLADWKTKWWQQKKGGGQCKKKDTASSATKALDITNVGGIFVVLTGGCFLASVVALLEFWFKTRQIPRSQRKPICSEILSELKMAFRCKGTKAIVKNREELTSKFSMNDEYVPS